MKKYLNLALMIIVCFAVVWIAATIAGLQPTPRETVLEQRIMQLEKRVDGLNARVDENDAIVNRWLMVEGK